MGEEGRCQKKKKKKKDDNKKLLLHSNFYHELSEQSETEMYIIRNALSLFFFLKKINSHIFTHYYSDFV